ncbi:hypothetical protein SLEP1_g5328 [Rubroshorea leprosula]|uniref:AP2/ERF domain-containing protein n=1 Tax=Rubroshorea leprosula TaxID=152421 RepID=A0AAV5HZI2_9ROSI|nr:hypothetical protein SLEP1_g5328 [Rubroshorea leprosula]
MKRSSVSSSCTSSSCSPSSSSSSDIIPRHAEKSKPKRARKIQNPEKYQNADSPPSCKRSSMYRGVTRHRWTGRFEAHLWDKSSWNNIQNKKGRQVYLGAYDSEESAARTYDLAALKYWGPETTLNFPLESYTKELEEMDKVSKEEYLASLRRQSSGFSRGVSKYRGVARHHHNGRWEARIGRVFGNKYLYLGTYNTQEEAAAAYDMAALEYRGANAVTNFDISHYIERLRKKGIIIHLDQTRIQKQPQNPTTQSQDVHVEVEVEVEQPQSQQQQQQQQPQQQVVAQNQLQDAEELPQCMDATPMIIMEPLDDQDLQWNFYTDTGFNPYPVPDDVLLWQTGELPDLIDCASFEDDIDFSHFIFDEENIGNEANPLTSNGRVEVGVLGNTEEDDGRVEASDSPSSTTTTVSGGYSV